MFSRAPFVLILPPLMVGILLFDKVENSFIITLISLISSLILYLVISFKDFFHNEKLKISLLFVAIITLGGVIVSLERTHTIPIRKDASVIVNVTEIASSDKDWRKSICKIESVLLNDSITRYSENILLFFNSPDIKEGDILLIHTDLERIKNKNNPGEFDVKSYWTNKDIYRIGFVSENDFKYISTIELSWFDRIFKKIRNSLNQQLKLILTGEELGVASALLLGDKELLSNETRNSFSNAGAMHVLAVSGLHVGIVLTILMFLLARLTRFISKKNATIIAIIIIWVYAGTTGFSPSVMRASFMFSTIALGQISGRNNNSMNVLMFSAFVLLIFNPLWIYDIGFQLSYLAMVGIFLLYQPIAKFIYFKNKWLMKIWQGTAVGFAAQAFTVPLTLYYFHQFPNYFVLTNIGMMVFAGFVLGIGLFFFAFSWTSILNFVIGNLLKFGLLSMLVFVQFIDAIPFSVATGFSLSEEMVYLIYFLMIFAIIPTFKKFRKIVLLLFLIVFIQIEYNRFHNLNQSEMVVFNSEDFALSIKCRNEIICLYSANKNRIKKVELLMKQYVATKPGNYRLIALKEGRTNVNFSGDQFSFYSNKYGVTIDSKKIQLHIRTNYSGNFFELRNSYDMSYLAKNSDRYNLGDGAKIIPLN